MSDQFWLTEAQLKRIEPHFPLPYGVLRVDDRRVVSGILHVIRNGLRWRDSPEVYGPHKTLYNRCVRWSRMGIFDRILANLAAAEEPPNRLMIDSRQSQCPPNCRQSAQRGDVPRRIGCTKGGLNHCPAADWRNRREVPGCTQSATTSGGRSLSCSPKAR